MSPFSLVIPYILVVLLHTLLQEYFAAKERSAALKDGGGRWPSRPTRTPSVDVVIPCYNESPQVLEACCASLANQDYEGRLRVLLIDDGSANLDQLLPVYGRYQAFPGWTILRFTRNQGKRKAQNAAIHGFPIPSALFERGNPVFLRRSEAEFVVMVDSDTLIEPDGIRRILDPFVDDEVAAVTGHVGALNRDQNLLTSLIDERYRLLSFHERAAQSYFARVFCCAGPFSAYRRNALDEVSGAYIGRTFLGAPCTFGDDLQLTHLVLEKGGKSVYQPLARASTIVPSSVGGYLRQQWRWNRSFYRQFRWILPVLRGNLNLYLMLDLVARSCPPMLLALALLWAAWDLVTAGAQPATDLLAVTTMTLISLSLVLWQTRKPGFVLLYGLLYLLLLIPTRLWALCTLGDSRWGSRTLIANSEWQSSSSRNRRHPGTAQRNRLAS